VKFGAFYCTPTDCTEEVLFAESMDAAYAAAKRRAATGAIRLPDGEADELAVMVIPLCGDALSVVPELTRATVLPSLTRRATPMRAEDHEGRHWPARPTPPGRELHAFIRVPQSSDAEPAYAGR